MSKYRQARERYRVYRRQTRELIEEEALHTFRRRVDVVGIDEDILRRAKRDWYPSPTRHVQWDWERNIIAPLHRYGARTFDAAYLVDGQLCALAAARVSPSKEWISLTFLEGCPEEHPLRGKVIPLVIRSLYVFRGVISVTEPPEHVGIRILRPLAEALHCYTDCGYTAVNLRKTDSTITVETPQRRRS